MTNAATAATAAPAALAAGSTREQILAVARGFIETRSYLGFSFQDVADAVGVRKASLYHHFATKEALGIAVIRAATQGFKDWDAARAREPRDALESYFRMYRNTLRAGSAVCPAGALAPGWGVINDELRLAVQELRNTQVTWLTGVLGALASEQGTRDKADQAAKTTKADKAPNTKRTSVASLAAYVFSVCQGALLSARMTGRVEDFDEAIAQLRSSLPG
ncbi:TetR/AcrR family transcriptional regulator [Variovorax sp. J22G73]|jgi:TetR/AcrR family transcriptional repressor of nem operon|uniref:TetR/AcrR family transcriptional regulator n=1 Tax=unclassified Variovorax TaxID=663243 RepID=UPI000D5D30B5|nr:MULTISPECIES: TetR/AcrR family transcriptional regulator [unclassified Variovorax]MDM0003650.1 TetR/AcrR family transcriptional regulator [Variovorax sp. J22R203]MDM0096684.1 TetR/AcrR family transcriptional regulator [Variovorax sp. J22G73]